VFNTDKYVVFVCEQANEAISMPMNEYRWVSYDEFLSGHQDDEIKKIAASVKRDYDKNNGFAPYFAWLRSVCAEKNIRIIGDIAQVKSEWVFRVPSNTGDLYLKIVGDIDINEAIFTHKLMESGVPNLPEWIAYSPDLNAFLMQDMGGNDLSSCSDMEIDGLLNLFAALSRTQKTSIPYVNSEDFYGYDYRIGATIDELKDFPRNAYKILSGTQYEITLDEKKKLIRNTECVIAVLKSINNVRIPDTIHNSDMAAYNVRCVEGKYIFYDWAWGGASIL